MDETAALAEIRGTQIARQAHGLEAPEQRIVVIRDPMDPQRQRRFLALESDLDAKFIQNQPKALFNEEQYFRQLVASLVRVDKDLAAANVFGNVVADVGPAGVFDRASGVRALKTDLPSMEDQALINLLGIRGGAKRAFAESTLSLMAGMTSQQYHQYMLTEIQRVLPALKQTVAGFGLSNPAEIKAYDAMIKRLEAGLGVDWSKFHAVHSAVKIAVPKAPKAAPAPKPDPVAGYANGVVSVPGPKGKGDVVPAMLSPGEAVIPAGMAKKYAPLINGMISGNIPGYRLGFNDSQASRFNMSGSSPMQASHFDWSAPGRLSSTISEVEGYLGDFAVSVYSVSEKMEDGARRLNFEENKRLSDLGGTGLDVAAGGETYGATTLIEPRNRNQAYRVAGIAGTPFDLEGVIAAGARAEQMLLSVSTEAQSYAEEYRGMVSEAAIAREQLTSSNSRGARLDFMRENSVKALTEGYLENASTAGKFTTVEQARIAATKKISLVMDRVNSLIEGGMDEELALQEAKKMLIAELLKAKGEYASGPVGTGGGILRDVATGRASFNPNTTRGDPLVSMVPQEVKRQPSGGRGTAAIMSATFIELEEKAETTALAMAEVTKSAVLRALEKGLGIDSPSREYENISNSVTAGVRSATDDAAAAGQEIGTVAVKSMQATATTPGVYRVPGSRRATTNPDLAPMPSGTQTGGARVSRKATAPAQTVGGSDQTGLMNADGMMLQVGASAGRASAEIDKLGKTAKKGGVGLLGYGGIVSNLTFGATALAGAMSTVGGEVGAFGQEIFKVSGFIFAATSIIQAYNQMKIGELAITRLAVAKQAMAFATYGTGVAAGKGLASMLARAAIGVGAFLGVAGGATIALGLLVGGIYLVNKAREEEQARIEGLGKVANLAADKIKKLAGIFGITPTPSPIDTATLVPGVTPGERIEANEVRASEGFAEEYAAELNAIRIGAQKDVELALQFLSVKLSGMGFEPGMIDTIVNALLLEAGRTDLELDFKSINVGAEGGVQQSISAIQQAANDVNAGSATGVKGTSGSILFDKESGERVSAKDEVQALIDGTAERGFGTVFTEEYLTKINTLSQGLASTVSGLSSAFANSSIDIEEFSAGMDGVSNAIMGIQDEAARETAFSSFVEGLRTDDNATFIDGLKKLAPTAKNIADSMILIKAQAGGIQLPDGIIEAIDAVNSGGGNASQIAAVNKLRADASGLIDNQIVKQKELNDSEAEGAAANAAVDAASATLKEQNLELENSITAYDFLIEKGYSAADAFTLASNAGYAAAIAASAADPEQWGKINEELDEFLKKTGQWKKISSSGSGSAPQKGPFEDILTSLKNIADKSVNVKGGIDEIFKLFRKNRDISLNRGFESLFVKGNFNASFAKFLADAEAKTRDLLVRFKNGKAILTDFGLAVQKAFQANSLATFRQELRLSLQSIGNQRTAIKALVANNISYADAVKIASNAEAASAIATAASRKSKKQLLDLLRLIRKEQKLQLILQGEQEIEDKKQSKIQETKDMLEGIRQQIREYNNVAKAQEKLAKSSYTLIEQQAILRDPVLITMLLEGLEPELLRAKLKQAVNPEFMQGIFEEGFNKAMESFDANDQALDIQLRIKTEKDQGILRDAQEDIAKISFEIDDLEADLTRLEAKEEEISSAYDKRIEALEEIKSINDDLVDQQDKQLTIADALSQGDISAAAKAAQDLRASQAARSIDMQTEALEKSRETELAALRSASGKSRAEIEKIIKDLQMEIFEIEESRLEPAQRRVDIATAESEKLAASYKVLGLTKLEWDGISSNITSAKTESDLYKDSIETSLGLVNDLATAWGDVKTAQAAIPFPETPDSAAVTAANEAAKKEAEQENKKDKARPNSKDSATPVRTITPAGPTPAELARQKAIEESVAKARDLQKQRDAAKAKLDALDKRKALLGSNLIDEKQRTSIVATIHSLDSQIRAMRGFAVGGFVSGPGTPTSDSIPAMLSDGEYVIKAASVNKFGKGFLDSINSGQLPGYKKGGKVTKKPSTSAMAEKQRAAMIAEKKKDSAAITSILKQKQTNKIFDTVLNAAKKIPLLSGQAEGIEIAKSLGKLFGGKAKGGDYATLGLGALGMVPGGRAVSTGAKALKGIKQAKGIIPTPKGYFPKSPVGGKAESDKNVVRSMGYNMQRYLGDANSLYSNPERSAEVARFFQLGEEMIPGGLQMYRVPSAGEVMSRLPRNVGEIYRPNSVRSAATSGDLQQLGSIFTDKTLATGGNQHLAPGIAQIFTRNPIPGIQDLTKFLSTRKADARLPSQSQFMKEYILGPNTSYRVQSFTPGKGNQPPSWILEAFIEKFAKGGMVKMPRREPPPVQMAGGGMVPQYFGVGGAVKKYAKGGDVVPAMLTPGEFVMSKYAVDNFGADKMKAINNGTYSSDSVYNYSINVNVQTDANANDIARNVMTEIRRIDSQKIRGNKF
jgi:hypothetical protein